MWSLWSNIEANLILISVGNTCLLIELTMGKKKEHKNKKHKNEDKEELIEEKKNKKSGVLKAIMRFLGSNVGLFIVLV